MPANWGSLPSTRWPTFPNSNPNIQIKPGQNLTRVVKFCSLESGLVQKSRRTRPIPIPQCFVPSSLDSREANRIWNQFSSSIVAGAAGNCSESDGGEVGFHSSANPRVGKGCLR